MTRITDLHSIALDPDIIERDYAPIILNAAARIAELEAEIERLNREIEMMLTQRLGP